MKKLLLIFLIIVANPAWAGWAKLGETVDRTNYIDHATIQKNGQFVTVWHLTDMKPSKKKPGSPSTTAQMEYDCKKEKVRFIAIITYTGNMQSGKSHSILTKPTQWEPTPPNTTAELALNIVCHEWIKIIDADNTIAYFDPVTIHKNKQFVTIWFLLDFKQHDYKDSYGALSVRTQVEYDCKKTKKRFLLETAHSDSMASGDILAGSTKATEWEPIEIDIDKHLLSIVCN